MSTLRLDGGPLQKYAVGPSSNCVTRITEQDLSSTPVLSKAVILQTSKGNGLRNHEYTVIGHTSTPYSYTSVGSFNASVRD